MKRISLEPVVKFFIIIIGLVTLFGVLKELQFIFVPLVIAYLLVFIFLPLNNYLIKNKIPYVLTTLIDLIIILTLFWLLSTFIIDAFKRFSQELPIYELKLNNIIQQTARTFHIEDKSLVEFNLSEFLSELDYGGILGGLFTTTLSFFSATFLILFFFIFVNTSHNQIIGSIKNRFVQTRSKISTKGLKKKGILISGEENSDETVRKLELIRENKELRVEKTFKDITHKIQKYIAMKFLISLTTAILVGIVLWIFDVEFLLVWAVLTFFLNFIPNIGSIIAIILPTLMTLIQYESIGYTLLIGGILSLIQNLIGNIIEPKLMGDRLGLNPLVILLALLIWGYIWGIPGMFLSVPLTAVIQIIISNSDSPNLKFLNDLISGSLSENKAKN